MCPKKALKKPIKNHKKCLCAECNWKDYLSGAIPYEALGNLPGWLSMYLLFLMCHEKIDIVRLFDTFKLSICLWTSVYIFNCVTLVILNYILQTSCSVFSSATVSFWSYYWNTVLFDFTANWERFYGLALIVVNLAFICEMILYLGVTCCM